MKIAITMKKEDANMRVEDITKLCAHFTRVTIKARTSIFGRLHDVTITSVLVKHGHAEIETCNLVLLWEEVIEIESTAEGLTVIVKGCE